MNLLEIQQALRDQRFDGWLFFDHHQRDPLAYRILGLPPGAVATRRWYYFIPAHGEPRGLVHRIERSVLDSLPGSKAVYSSWSGQADGLKKILANSKRIAMQYSPECAIPYVAMVDAGTVEMVRGVGVEVASSADLVQLFEARWSRESLESHLEAGRRVDDIRRAAFQLVAERIRNRETILEFAVKEFILDEFDRACLVTDHGPIVAVNANCSNPHYEPSSDRTLPIQKGDCLLIDMWARLDQPDSVYYDITWTAFCGLEPPHPVQNVFQIVREARDRAIQRVQDAVAAGQSLRGFEVDDAARDYIKKCGFGDYFIHRTGHSIGTEVHGAGANMDNLETHDERRIIPWTCFSIEPGVYLPEFGIRSEVDVFVDEDGARVTGEKQEQLVVFDSL
jgi:Xaa-Pro aminopeptidase